MGEEALLQLSQQFLNTPQGKSLLGSSLNISDITNRIQELSSKYNIDLSTLESSSLKDINLSIGSNLNKKQKKLTAKERLQERLDEAGIDNVNSSQKVRAELSLLKAKLNSQIPILQSYTITGRLQDKNTNTPIQGVKVTLGVNQDFAQTEVVVENPLNTSGDLTTSVPSTDLNDLVFTPVSGQNDRTDKQGNFSIKVRIPIIPESQKTPLLFGLLYSKSGYLPGSQSLIKGDKTIKTNLSLASLKNIDEASKDIAYGFNSEIDQAQVLLNAVGLDPFDAILSAKKLTLNKIVDTIKTKLMPLLVTLLLAFGISKLSQKNRKTCPSPDALRDVIRTRNRVVRQLNQIYSTIIINTALAVAFNILAKVLIGVRIQLDNLPIPGSFGGPGPIGLVFSLPYSFTAKLQDINDKLESLEKNNKGISRATLTSLVFVIAGATTAILLLKSIDQMTQECIQEAADNNDNNNQLNLELVAINQDLLDISEEEAEDGNPVLSNVNGFIFSVETDNTNLVGTLKRRFAVAKDSRGITLLRGESSFSSSDQILIDELVFYIQQNDLKAN